MLLSQMMVAAGSKRVLGRATGDDDGCGDLSNHEAVLDNAGISVVAQRGGHQLKRDAVGERASSLQGKELHKAVSPCIWVSRCTAALTWADPLGEADLLWAGGLSFS